MIGVLQWGTLAVCCIITLGRLPSALRGENRSLFSIFALLTLAILLSIDAPYVAVDQALGGMNVANLVLRFVIFAAVFFLGFRMARGFGADDARRLITGPIGIAAAAAASAAVVVVFLMMDTAGSSAGLAGIAAKDGHQAALVECYGAAGRLYPAFIMLALFPAMLRTLRSGLSVLVRCGAALLALGAVAISLSLLFPAIPPPLGFLRFVINYTAVLCVVLGLVLFWMAKGLAKRGSKKQASLTGVTWR